MTQEKDLQSLIADIDSILPKFRSRLLWSGGVEGGRQLLERVRSYLVSIEQNLPTTSPIPTNTPPTHPSVVQQIRQAVNQEIQSIRASVTGSLQAELVALRQERDAIVQEIRQLENTRRESLDRIAQDVISRSSETLTEQLAQILVAWEAQQRQQETVTEATSKRGATLIPPQERLEQMRQTELQFDRMLMTLDANQRAIFEALQRNLYTYQDSLSQELDKMHRLGIQGEVLFTALVKRLSQLSEEQGAIALPSSSTLSDGTETTPVPTNAIASVTESSPQTSEVTGSIPEKPPNDPSLDPLSLIPPPHPLFGTDSAFNLSPNPIDLDATVKSDRIGEIPDLPSTTSIPISEDIPLGNQIDRDWEPIEEIEDDNRDESGKADTFIQLDITPPESFSLDREEENNSINSPDSPSIDFMLEPEAEVLPEPGSFAGWHTDIDELQLGIEPWDRDINNLYDNLFNTENFSEPANLNEYDFDLSNEIEFDNLEMSEDDPDFPPTIDEFTPADSRDLFSEDRDFQFGEITDLPIPIESTPLLPLVEPMADEHESWQVVSFEESVFEAAPDLSYNLGEKPQSPPENVSQLESKLESQIDSPSESQSEKIDTVAALTELLEEMGLADSSRAPAAPGYPETPQIFTTREEQWLRDEPFDREPSTPRIDDSYIPASPDEDLLSIDELTGNSEADISLEADILDQLSEDLNSFEEFPHQANPDQQILDDSYWESPRVIPTEITDFDPLPNQQFAGEEDLLADDWEEFAFQDFSQDDLAFPSWENGATTGDLLSEEIENLNRESENFDSEVSEAEFVEDIIPVTPESLELDADFFDNGFLDFGTEYVVDDDIIPEDHLPLIEDEDDEKDQN